MELFETDPHQIRDLESRINSATSSPFGIVSCYETRLNSTMIIRAMDRELNRRPLTKKCGRLAKIEHPQGEPVTSRPLAAATPQNRFVQVIGRSPLQPEPA